MKKFVTFLTFMLLAIILVGALFHFFTAVPAVVNTSPILIAVSGIALIVSLAGVKVSAKKINYLAVSIFMGCSLVVFIYDGYFGFTKENITINSEGTVLAASLYSPPESDCPCQGVVFVHGSGPMTRKDYRYLAKKFARNGIVSLIYDKRGTGGSEGHLYSGGYDVYAKDAASVFEHLTTVEKAGTIGFIGFSEGEWVLPLTYPMLSEKPEFLIVVGASGLSPASQVNEEIEIRLRKKGFSNEEISKALRINEAVYNFQRYGTNRDSLLAILSGSSNQPYLTEAGDIPVNENELGEHADYDWWRSVMDTDPRDLWQKINPAETDLLFIKGASDDRSYADRSEERIRSFFPGSSGKQADFRLFSNADHMLLEWPVGEQVPPPVFTKGYLNTVTDWIRNRDK